MSQRPSGRCLLVYVMLLIKFTPASELKKQDTDYKIATKGYFQFLPGSWSEDSEDVNKCHQVETND